MAVYIDYLTALTDTNGPITIEGVDYDGRLFNLTNTVPAGHDAAGVTAGEAVVKRNAAGSPAANGKIGVLFLGMSNARRVATELIPLMTSKQDAVVVVNGCQTNRDLDYMIDNEATYYADADGELADKGLEPEQVGAIVLYTAIAGPTGSIADHIAEIKSKLKTVIVDQIAVRYPNCKQVYLISREFGGYTLSGNPEPYAFAQAIAIRELVLDQVNYATTGDPDLDYNNVPWLGWTTNLYTWANGLGSDEATGGTPGRADGLEYESTDFDDGLHPSVIGATKIANLILPEFESGNYAAPWWYASLTPQTIAIKKDTDGDATTTTDSYTPTLNVHQLIIIANRAGAAATAEQPVPTGHSATYALEETITHPASNRNRLSVFRGVGTGVADTLAVTFNSQNQAAVQVVVIETPDLYIGGTAAALSVIESISGAGIGVTELEIAATTSANVALMIAAFTNTGSFAVNPQTGYSEPYDDTAGASNGLEIQTLVGYSSPAKATKAAGGTFDVAGILVTLRLPPPKYQLAVMTSPETAGTITSDPAGIDYPDVPDYEFYEGTEVTLTAVANPGYRFMGWSGDIDSSSGNEATVTVDGAKTITAVFRSTKNEAGAARGLQLALLDEPGGRQLADYSHLAYGLTISDGLHGRESLLGDIDLLIRQAARWGAEQRVLYVRLADGPEIVWDGRLEDKTIGDGGLSLTALGYWRALFDVPYVALWSYTGVAAWRPVTSDDAAGYAPERFEIDNNNRLYMAPREDENYDELAIAAWTLETPLGENSGQRDFIAIDFDYYLYAPADWEAFLLSGDRDDFNSTARWSLASIGSPELGTVSITFAASERLIFGLYFNDSTPGPPGGVTGETFLRITNIRVATTTRDRVDTVLGTSVPTPAEVEVTPGSMAGIYVGQKLRIDERTPEGETVTVKAITATTFTADFANNHSTAGSVEAIVVYADEIAEALLDFVNGINPGQLADSAAGIEAHDRDLLDEWYGDAIPADILTYLAAKGDLSGQIWEVGVREDRRLFFRPKGTYAATWYADVTAVQLQQSIEALYNSAYGVYQDANWQAQRTKNNADELSIQRHGLTRRAAVPASTTSDSQAQSERDAFLSDAAAPTPRLVLDSNELYTAGGAQVRQKWRVQAGDTVVLRNVDPTLLGSDELLSFVISRRVYDAANDQLEVELQPPSIPAMLARVLAFTNPRGGGNPADPRRSNPADPRR